MERRVIDILDGVLSAVFWLPARVLGMEKCSRCTVVVRHAQCMLWATQWLGRWGGVRERRIEWEARVAARDGLQKVRVR